MKRPEDTLLTKTADGLTRCPSCRRHVVAGNTPMATDRAPAVTYGLDF